MNKTENVTENISWFLFDFILWQDVIYKNKNKKGPSGFYTTAATKQAEWMTRGDQTGRGKSQMRGSESVASEEGRSKKLHF